MKKACLLLLLPLLCFGQGAILKPNLRVGLVGWYTFNEGTGLVANDYNGRTNTAYLTNTPAWTNGWIGGALYFNSASNQWVNCFSNSGMLWQLGALTNALTIAFWANLTSTSTVQTAVFGDYTGTGQPIYDVTFNQDSNGYFAFHYNDNDGVSSRLDNKTQLQTNTWYHITCTRDYGGGSYNLMHVFVNGVQDDGKQFGSTGWTRDVRAQVVAIGRAGGFNGQYFNGFLDDVRFYNRALGTNNVDSGAPLINPKQAFNEIGELANGRWGVP